MQLIFIRLICSQSGLTALHLAALYGKDKTVALLLDRGADITARGGTVSAKGQHDCCLTYYCQYRANLPACCVCMLLLLKDGSSALHIAAYRGNDTTVALLLDRRANIAAKTKVS